MRYVASQFRIGKPDLQGEIEARLDYNRDGDDDEDSGMLKKKKERERERKKKRTGGVRRKKRGR